MNERIKALMGQTLDEKFAGTWSTMDMQDLQKFAERFAELIVRECMDIARNVGNISEPDDWALDRCYEIEQRIQDCFGVEE